MFKSFKRQQPEPIKPLLVLTPFDRFYGLPPKPSPVKSKVKQGQVSSFTIKRKSDVPSATPKLNTLVSTAARMRALNVQDINDGKSV